MYELYDENTATPDDRFAWGLCQILDYDAPKRWTQYRFAGECIAGNDGMMSSLKQMRKSYKLNKRESP